MVEALIARLADGAGYAPLLGLAVGVVLTLSPVSFPTIPAVMATLSPGQLDDDGRRERTPLHRAALAVLAFVIGMDGVLAAAGYSIAAVAVLLIRASVALHLLAATVLGAVGVRLLARRTSLCRQAQGIPLGASEAFLYGLGFSVAGCPACGPVVVGLASATALVATPATALLVLVAFVAGRTVVLLGAASIGARLLPTGTSRIRWARLDLLVGVLLVLAAAFYVWRVVSGEVTTVAPGEPGGLLP